jgi:hypothetical protein
MDIKKHTVIIVIMVIMCFHCAHSAQGGILKGGSQYEMLNEGHRSDNLKKLQGPPDGCQTGLARLQPQSTEVGPYLYDFRRGV